MPHKLEHLKTDHALIITWTDDSDLRRDHQAFVDETKAYLDQLSEPVHLINVFANLKLSLNDIVSGASGASRGENSLSKHAMIKGIIFVTEDRTLRFAAKGLNTVSFGFVDVKVLGSLDEALDFIRSQAA